MRNIEVLLNKIKRNPKNALFKDLCRICDFYFGLSRQRSGSHRIYRTPWLGDPRINIQNDKGKAKTYQVKQVLCAIEKMESDNVEKN